MRLIGTWWIGKNEDERFGKIEVTADTYEEARAMVIAQLPEGAKLANVRVPDSH